MTGQPIRFDDGAAYEQMMGVWSRKVGAVFIDWLKPQASLDWIDVGCGNGAFTELIMTRAQPAHVAGVDPSEGQLTFARQRPGLSTASFKTGDAMALPYPDAQFDAAIMALVLVFVPDPAKGVAEMVRVVKPGGVVAAYMWDMLGGGFPLEPLYVEMRAMDIPLMRPPQVGASRMDAMRGLWEEAGLTAIETRDITVERSFAGFEAFWATALQSPTQGALLASLAPDVSQDLQMRVRGKLAADSQGQITLSARANAITGRRP